MKHKHFPKIYRDFVSGSNPYLLSIMIISVSDPFHFDTDPNPDSTKNHNFYSLDYPKFIVVILLTYIL